MEWSYLKTYYLDSQTVNPSSGYLRCPSCGFLTRNPEMGDPAVACPECSDHGKPRFHWPVLEAYTLFSMIREMMNRGEKRADTEVERVTSELANICRSSVQTETVESLLRQIHNMSCAEAEKDGKLAGLINSHLEVPSECFDDVLCGLIDTEAVTDEHKVVVVLTMSLTEVLLNDFLANVLVANRVNLPVARKCVRACETYTSKNALFKDIVGESIQRTIKGAVEASKSSKSFLDDLQCIRNRRNAFIHGDPDAISREHARRAFSVAVESFAVFADLFNRHCRLERETVPDVPRAS